MKRYLGVDLHKHTFSVCYLIAGEKEQYKKFKISQLEKFKLTLQADDEIAVEATGNSLHFCRVMLQQINHVVMVDPGQFKVISFSHKKTDKQDCYLLALYLSKGMLPKCRIMDSQRAEVKSLVGTRDKLVKLRTTLKNKVHTILNAHGITSHKESLTSNKGLERVKQYQLPDLVKIELAVLLDQIKYLNEGIEKIEHELKKPERQLPGHQNLVSIKGIGDTGASVLLSVIGNVEDFANAKKLCAYFGLVPRVHQSDEKEYQGRITKRGSKLGRTILVQCALIALRYNPILRAFYDRLRD